VAREDLEAATVPEAVSRRVASRLESLPVETLRLLRTVGERAPAGAWLVGGVVRDLLLGRVTRDLDVVVRDPLSSVIAGLPGRRVVHDRFGTATIDHGGLHVDFVEARRESYRTPAALPDVERAPLADDLFRRDFTANALALDLSPGRFGSLVDLYGGLADLRHGQLRVFHGLSFIDDPTRAFRAVRLAARLGWAIEPRTWRLLRRAVDAGAVDRLSPARVLRELRLAFEEVRTPEVVDALGRHALLSAVGLDVVRARGALRRLSAVLDWVAGLDVEPVSRWVVVLGLLLPSEPEAVLERLRPERADRAAAAEIARSARPLARRLARSERPSTIWRACHGLCTATWVAAVAASTSPRTRRGVERYVMELRHARLAIDGADVAAAGVPRGPAIAQALDAARAALLDGHAPDAAAQLGAALRIARGASG
jgi:tRNA nucleotidyltransferase (CCA-adding enzyme)